MSVDMHGKRTILPYRRVTYIYTYITANIFFIFLFVFKQTLNISNKNIIIMKPLISNESILTIYNVVDCIGDRTD